MPRPREAELEANGAAGYSSVPAIFVPKTASRRRPDPTDLSRSRSCSPASRRWPARFSRAPSGAIGLAASRLARSGYALPPKARGGDSLILIVGKFSS